MPDARDLDVLVPTRDRPVLVTLAGLAARRVTGARVVISDRSRAPVAHDPPAESAYADVVARLRVRERYGGAGRAYRLEPPTTVLEQP
ncbi:MULTISPECIES: hypothetical protein [Nonomuraea]|uniref:Uncharacterized protein n=1 Tax=Nonomuraea ferruginea TaxID=46174 RepID=A0ABT4TB30_9ACTN|nr:hypothetical protein [Nonomuraea ferruginea]MDA0646746.1 hypothetical protein [Nonomuraea ferruginea]